jgi:hypothetical protein
VILQRLVLKEIIQLAGDVKHYVPATDSDNEDAADGEAVRVEPPPECFKFEECVDSIHNLSILEQAAKLVFKEQQVSQELCDFYHLPDFAQNPETSELSFKTVQFTHDDILAFAKICFRTMKMAIGRLMDDRKA